MIEKRPKAILTNEEELTFVQSPDRPLRRLYNQMIVVDWRGQSLRGNEPSCMEAEETHQKCEFIA